jgi:hypothetical protein
MQDVKIFKKLMKFHNFFENKNVNASLKVLLM